MTENKLKRRNFLKMIPAGLAGLFGWFGILKIEPTTKKRMTGTLTQFTLDGQDFPAVSWDNAKSNPLDDIKRCAEMARADGAINDYPALYKAENDRK